LHLDDILVIKRGSIYYWNNYEFNANADDNRNKYWLTLNCIVNDFPVNIVLPTSQINNHFYSQQDNLIDTVIIEANESQFFNKKTILDLKNITHEYEEVIKDAWGDGFLRYLGELESKLFTRVETAIRNAITISPMDKREFLCE